ncbi:MAG TPA: DUF5004 domain-containing protein [Panacibacter sp.]|nr:DUF5004 domain-containing protein [Panacibacter sp.]
MRKSQYFFVLIVTFFSVFSSCKTQKDVLVEPIKDFTGSWKISKVLRNQEDITQWLNLADFKLELKNDNSFTLTSGSIPFLENTDGTWTVDDPAYPFHLSLQAKDSTSAKTADLLAPVAKGSRNMVITFSPGCNANKYVYTLEHAP